MCLYMYKELELLFEISECPRGVISGRFASIRQLDSLVVERHTKKMYMGVCSEGSNNNPNLKSSDVMDFKL
ncbi:hypothetical protein K0M31_005572 [Melipona bicolor]|uniref:Uncharacterized protein n=1 Tax=Melipona bicolor TaxID=60889 RepID=A0AA40KML6_9HYME|nr:hypothetical protein K0M31_005572 [Melipona bicolor]